MHILFIANSFPPVNSSASIRALNYVNYLSILGCKVSVIKPAYPKDFLNYDESLLEQLNKNVTVYDVPMGSIYYKIYPKKPVNASNVQVIGRRKFVTKMLKKFKSSIKNYVAVPDSYFEWRKRAYKKGMEVLKEKQIDIMISMHETPSSHLVAYKLKKKYINLKWVTYWSDPWTFDPNRENHPFLRKLIEKNLERKVTNLADKFLFTTKKTKLLYEKEYGIKNLNTDIVFRGYNPDYYSSLKLRDKPTGLMKDKINIIHAGEIYTKLRNIDPFIQSLKSIKERNPYVYNRLNILLIGGIDDYKKKEDLKDFDCIKVMPRISYDESLIYMLNSDILLLWGNKYGEQIPGKVYDYFGLEKPIITLLGSEEDPLKELLNKHAKGPIILNTEENITSVLIEITKRLENDDIPQYWRQPVKEFEWENVVKDLYSKL